MLASLLCRRAAFNRIPSANSQRAEDLTENKFFVIADLKELVPDLPAATVAEFRYL